MGQGSSSVSLLSRRSAAGSVVSNLSSSVTKFVKTSALREELLFQPHTSAHQAFRNYLSQKFDSDSRRRSGRRKKRSASRESTTSAATAEDAAADDMSSSLLHLSPRDVVNIRDSWASVETRLLQVGVRAFVVVFECQPNIKRTYRMYRQKNHSELRINEDLQKHIIYLISSLKRVVRYLSDPKALSKYLRRVAKKHSPCSVDFNRINPAEIGSVFCIAIRGILPKHGANGNDRMTIEAIWSAEVEASWTCLFANLLNAMHHLTSRHHDNDEYYFKEGSDAGAASGDSDSTSSSLRTTFDRHLVLVGCQSFQEFFDRHPEVLIHFDKFRAIEIDGVRVSDALRMHASRVLAIVEDIVENTGNPDKIRSLMQDLGRHHYKRGITQEHLDMLGPLICHTIRPLVFKAGLWSIEVEKSWTHLFDMVATLMKRGYPPDDSQRLVAGFFPTLTHTLILKDTWSLIVEQMHELGLSTFIKLFRLSANLRYYYPKQTRPELPETQEDINFHFEHLVAVVDSVVRCLPDLSNHVQYLRNLGSMHCDVEVQQRLLQLMGPVFCNTVRPLLLVQGRWSYQVEMAWLLLFRHIAGFMRSGYEAAVEAR